MARNRSRTKVRKVRKDSRENVSQFIDHVFKKGHADVVHKFPCRICDPIEWERNPAVEFSNLWYKEQTATYDTSEYTKDIGTPRDVPVLLNNNSERIPEIKTPKPKILVSGMDYSFYLESGVDYHYSFINHIIPDTRPEIINERYFDHPSEGEMTFFSRKKPWNPEETMAKFADSIKPIVRDLHAKVKAWWNQSNCREHKWENREIEGKRVEVCVNCLWTKSSGTQ